ncbi:DUF885 family protein [Salinibacterium sp. UTAS2018]|uniref:DUF885 family protein n=1 Tax=Salinibacterium sp. UTAS2018 TaxID=2508880 RepID=UPI00100955DF|nr:DUF885 family protein [Salinibacterium sp. UTAS2018]QAV70780.1 DUF885 family protein [Salinibacterium sp. UTAS2018]
MGHDAVQQLGAEIWQWRHAIAFHTGDDIPRVDRGADWVPQFSVAAIDDIRSRYAEFHARWAAIDVSSEPVPVQVDYRLVGSSLARVTWDIDTLRNWEKDAVFLTSQILGPFFDRLLQVPPFSAERQQALVTVAEAIPSQVATAQENLARAGVSTLAKVAAEMLSDAGAQFADTVEKLEGYVDAAVLEQLRSATPAAAEALTAFRDWLEANADSMAPDQAVGREKFVWFLRNVALVAAEPEDMVRAARQDYQRAVVSETIVTNRYRNLAADTLSENVEAQVAREAEQEQQVRDFYESENLLSQPDNLRHYLVGALPAYVEPLRWLGVTDDLTSEQRVDMDGISYSPDPTPGLPYFYAANARDPRLGIVHEGAHYQQLALASRHENPLRRRYYDSAANEGIAFYNEEMMMLAGLFTDSPHSEEVIHNFNRLRSLRVIADVSLATGEFSVHDSTQFFVDLVPMDRETALDESSMYIATPGLAMSYHVGKMLLIRLMTDAINQQKDAFSTRDFHDYVWLNGNVPFSLQRWELLGDRSDVDILDASIS